MDSMYRDLVQKISISPNKKTKQKNYLKHGALAVVDQGKELIGGYTDDISKRITCELPVIVFGDHTRAVKYVNFSFGAGADGIKILQPKQSVFPKYLYYATQYLVLRLENKGYARHYQHLEKKELNIPSFPEQKRIVAKTEELFSQLDSGVETLKKAKQQLAVYRQAVLKEAFEGKLSDSKATSCQPLAEFIEKPRYGTSKKCDYTVSDKAIPVYRIPNINYKVGRIDHNDIKSALFAKQELDGITLCEDDILIIRSNGSASLVGRAAIVNDVDVNGTFAGYLMRLRIKNHHDLVPRFLLWYLQAHSARIYIENKAKSTSGVHNINSSEISNLHIPVFPYQDQLVIIQAIESRMSVCDSIEQTIDAALQQAEALRQSILKKAFEGELT